VDFSEYLIDIGKKHFTPSPKHQFILGDVVDFCKAPIQANEFTKMLCYGSFAYIENSRAEELLKFLGNNFLNVSHALIGNCPDKDKLDKFFNQYTYIAGIEDEPDSPIGIWRTKNEFRILAQKCGWDASFHTMPEGYYASNYRYDVVLTRRKLI
jgi:hypothetical protein